MDDLFYAHFEARFRGSRAEIKKRQAIYLPLLASLREVFPDGSLLDLGCGRGEWLELASEAGWQAIGVDTDAGMLAHAAALGLNVQQAEALDYLRALPEASSAMVTSFHVVEHLPFTVLQDVVREIHRILRPGGILILETPNPENLTVGACSFYTDPTHRTPLPPELLNFLVECSDFARCRILRLNELPVDKLPSDFSLVRTLYGVSPDYAVIAQKKADPSITAAFLWPPESLGCSLMEMATAFDRGLHLQIDDMQSTLSLMISQVEELKLSQQELKLSQQELKLSQQELHAAYAGQVEELKVCRQELQAVYASRSWRYTAPYRCGARGCRALGRGLTSVFRGIILFPKSHLSVWLKAMMVWVGTCPWLKDKALWLLHRLPRVTRRLKRWLREDSPTRGWAGKKPVVSEDDLSPQTAKILADIRQQLQQQELKKEAEQAVPPKD